MLKRLYTLFIIITMAASSTIKAEGTVYPTLTTQGGTYELVVSDSKDASVLEDGGIYLFAGTNSGLWLMSTFYVNDAGTLKRFSAVQINSEAAIPSSITINAVNQADCPYEYVFKKKGDTFEFKFVDINNKCPQNIRTASSTNSNAVSLAPESESDGVYFTITRHDAEKNKWKLTNKNSSNQTVCFADITTTTSPKQLYFTCLNPNNYVILYKKVTASPNTVSFTMSNVGYATLYYGEKDVTLPEGLTACTYTLRNTQDATYLTPSHTYNAGEKIPAGTAVVVKGNEGNYTLTLSEIDNTLPKYDNVLQGCDEETELAADASKYFYKLTLNSDEDPNSVGFYWANEDGAAFTTLAHKAYLTVDKSAAAKGIVNFLDWDNQNTTGLVEIKANENAADVYGLNGKRVSASHKGIQIRKGKKYLMK